MANLGCLLVCTFGNFFAPVLVATHRVNNLDLGNEQGLENEGYESNLKKTSFQNILYLLLRQKKNCLLHGISTLRPSPHPRPGG